MLRRSLDKEQCVRPLIGIPCYAAERSDSRRPLYGNNQAYIHAVERAGGVPVLLPPLSAATDSEQVADHLCARLDGLLLSGGADIAPALYGATATAECGTPEVERDVFETLLTQRALAARLPILAICRGMQMLNVVLGGTLLQDIASQRAEAQQHEYTTQPRSFRAHPITLAPDSRLASILGAPTVMVNSFHHQALDRVAPEIEVVGWAADGIAEACELRGYPFALGVQYHPEELVSTDEPSQRLFAAFIQVCSAR